LNFETGLRQLSQFGILGGGTLLIHNSTTGNPTRHVYSSARRIRCLLSIVTREIARWRTALEKRMRILS